MAATYKKLISGGQRSNMDVSRISLWMAPDHLLQVEGALSKEEYRRFYFADIQSITLRRTNRRQIWNIILCIPLALFAALAFWVNDFGGRVALGITASPWLFFILYNSLRGPACVCHVATAVQKTSLPSLRRVRRAEKIIDVIRVQVAAAQGALGEADIREGLSRLHTGPMGTSPSTSLPPGGS